MQRWLETEGAENGWQASNGKEAQDFVNQGHAAIMIRSKREGRDHVALVRPGEGVERDNFYWPRVAQAGTIVSSDLSSYDSFGELEQSEIKFYMHE
jgi:hypothetical protein